MASARSRRVPGDATELPRPDPAAVRRAFRTVSRSRASSRRIEIEGADAGGGEFEWRFHTVAMFDADRPRSTCMESYAEDDFGAALARLDELGAGRPLSAPPAHLENSATRSAAPAQRAHERGRARRHCRRLRRRRRRDRPAVCRLAPTLRGRATIRENLEALRDVGLNHFRAEVLAVRGDRLALQRVVFSTADGREMTTLGLNEWDGAEVVRRVVFDEDALARGAGRARPSVRGRRRRRARRRDRGTGRGVFRPERSRPREVGRAPCPRLHKPRPHAHRVRRSSCRNHPAVRRGRLRSRRGTSSSCRRPWTSRARRARDDAGSGIHAGRLRVQRDLINVTRLDHQLRIAEDHLFSGDQWPEARELFERLAARTAPTRTEIATEAAAPTGEPENQLTRNLRESIARAQRGEPTPDGLVADDVVIVDRRSGVSAGTIVGSADFSANASAHFDVFVEARPTVLAVRGDRLALDPNGVPGRRLRLGATQSLRDRHVRSPRRARCARRGRGGRRVRGARGAPRPRSSPRLRHRSTTQCPKPTPTAGPRTTRPDSSSSSVDERQAASGPAIAKGFGVGPRRAGRRRSGPAAAQEQAQVGSVAAGSPDAKPARSPRLTYHSHRCPSGASSHVSVFTANNTPSRPRRSARVRRPRAVIRPPRPLRPPPPPHRGG